MARPVESALTDMPLQDAGPVGVVPANAYDARAAAVPAQPGPDPFGERGGPAATDPRRGGAGRDLVDEWAAPPTVRGPSLGPHGAVAFVGDREGRPQLWIRSADGAERVVDTGPGHVRSALWSPDGAWIAVCVAPGGGERTEVRVVRPDGSGLRRLAGGVRAGADPEEPSAAALARWAAGGRLLVVTESGPSGLTHALAVDLDGHRRHLAAGLALQVCDIHEGVRAEDAARPASPASPVGPVGSVGSVGPASPVGPGGPGGPGGEPGRWLLLLREGPRGARRVLVTSVAAVDPDRGGHEISGGVEALGGLGVPADCVVAGGTATTVSGVLSADGTRALVLCDLGRDRAGLVEVTLGVDGTPGATRVLAGRDDADLERFVLLDPATAVLGWNVGGRTELVLADLADLSGGSWRPLPPLPREVVTAALRAPGGHGLLLALDGSTGPGELWTCELDMPATGAATYRCLVSHTPTAYPTLEIAAVGAPDDRSADGVGYRLVRPIARRFPAHDGLELSGWWYRPPGTRGPLPTFLYFHGGPEAQERPVFNPLFHALLARGIAVFASNVRGSTGFGRSFEHADHLGRRFDGIVDVASAVDHLVGSGLADPGSIGVGGRSYGGYLTLAALVHHPELFAVGVDICGMVDLETFYRDTEPWIAASAVTKYGDPATDGELLRALSPLHRMDALAAPLLVVHGANDTNVPLCEAEQTVAAARSRAVPCDYLLFEGEGHEIAERANRLAFVRAVVDFVATRLVGSRDGEALGEAV